VTNTAAGVDGCRAGWAVATVDGVRVVPSFATILREIELIGVDMPVGLPSSWGRAADKAARAYVRPRGACVFPTPPRALLAYDSYGDANRAAKTLFGAGLTRQTFNLFTKIRDIDEAVDATSQHRVLEVHPECCFRAMTGTVLPPKRTLIGRSLRTEAIAACFGPIDLSLPGARADDVLDAYAVLWTVLRHQRGESLVLGGDEADERGLVMRIVV
jgi:predicted RNase H-like nuclease